MTGEKEWFTYDVQTISFVFMLSVILNYYDYYTL